MTKLCSGRPIIQTFTLPYTPQLTGVAERMNRTLIEWARYMLENSRLSKEYWGKAVVSAKASLSSQPIPRTCHKSRQAPHQVWTGNNPLLSNRKVFSCHSYVTSPKQKRTKFDAQSVYCRFIEYSENEKAYSFEKNQELSCTWESRHEIYERLLRRWKTYNSWCRRRREHSIRWEYRPWNSICTDYLKRKALRETKIFILVVSDIRGPNR